MIGLDDFGPGTGGNGDGVSVGEVLARGVPIRWDEAVALLQEVVDIANGVDDARIPAFDDIVIDREGAVAIQGTRRGERGPVAAARALHALLATAEVPVALRLFVTQATAPDTHRSLTAFADGLAYFGKPGRAGLIKALYERHHASAGATAATARPEVPPLPTSARPDQASAPERSRRSWLMPAAVISCLASLGAVLWFGVFPAGGRGGASVVAQAKAAIGSVAAALTNAPAPNTGTTPLVEAPAQDTAPSSAVAPLQSTRIDPVARLGPEASAGSPDRRSAARSPRAVPPASRPATVGTAAAAPAVPVAHEFVVAPRENTESIYSRADVDVQPPVMLYPALPPPVFVASDADPLVVNRMELVVAADGRVERVRLLNGPTRLPDMMLLSGAKLWRFTPAVKDGVPVRYRTTVTWSGFP